MKRILCALLMVALVLSGLACAEEFALRNGVHFGDTVEQIKQKEVMPPVPGGDSGFYIDFYGEIAGFPKAVVRYFYDEGQFSHMLYIFSPDRGAWKPHQFLGEAAEYMSHDAMLELYNRIKDSMIRQYGPPVNQGNKAEFPVNGMISSIMLNSYDTEPSKSDLKYLAYDEWVVDGDTANAKIEMMYTYVKGSTTKNRDSYSLRVSYDPFTAADLEEKQAEKDNAERTIDDDF